MYIKWVSAVSAPCCIAFPRLLKLLALLAYQHSSLASNKYALSSFFRITLPLCFSHPFSSYQVDVTTSEVFLIPLSSQSPCFPHIFLYLCWYTLICLLSELSNKCEQHKSRLHDCSLHLDEHFTVWGWNNDEMVKPYGWHDLLLNRHHIFKRWAITLEHSPHG